MDKKRSASEMKGEDDDVYGKIDRLEQQIKTLQQDNVVLKTKLSEYEDESDDDEDDDDTSVCDGSTWSQKFVLMKQFKQQNGHCKVSRSDKQLGTWVMNLRNNRRKGKVPQHQIDKLDKIGFSWGKGFPEPKTWEESFRELQKYHDTFGHCNIHVDPNPDLRDDLAKWVMEQRKQGKRLQKSCPSSLTQEQYKQLDGLSFKWKVPKRRRS
eukprot:scaffold2633_cov156-Amphora_coffeaeformis.AAC.8